MGKLLKLGGGGMPRIEFDSPKPPPVHDHYDTSTEKSGVLSERCQWWLRQIERGWRPNRRILNCCWDCNSEWLGVYGWEYTDVICVALGNGRFGDFDRAAAERAEALRLRTPLGPKDALDSFKDDLNQNMLAMLKEEIDRAILYGEGELNAPNDRD